MSTNPYANPDYGNDKDKKEGGKAAANPYKDEKYGEARGFTGQAKDIGVSLLEGAVSVPEAAVGVADMFTGGRAGKLLENKDGAVGFRPGEAKEIIADQHTEDYKYLQQQFADADGVIDKAGVAITNPSMIANTVAQSLPAMGAGAVAGRGLQRVAGKRKGADGVETNRLSDGAAAAAGEGLTMAGMQAEEIRQETDDGLLTGKQIGLSGLTGVAGTLFAWGGNKLAKKLGVGDVDELILRGMRPDHVAGEIASAPAKSIPRQIIEGAIIEGFLEELPQSVSETILQNLALDKPWHEGVEDAAVMGTLAGMAMGGAGAGYSGYNNRGADTSSGLPDADIPPAGDAPKGFSPSWNAPPVVPEQYRRETLSGQQQVAPKPSEVMGINPDAGPLSSAAATAVDSGASQQVSHQEALAQAAQEAERVQAEQPKQPEQKPQQREQQPILGLGEVVDPETGEVTKSAEALQQRIDYINNQAQMTGWTKGLVDARTEATQELNKLLQEQGRQETDAQPQQEPEVEQVPQAQPVAESEPAEQGKDEKPEGRTEEKPANLQEGIEQAQVKAAAAESEAAGAPADIRAIIAKQVPDMTDAEIRQAIEHYGPDHKRTKKLEKALAKREGEQKGESYEDAKAKVAEADKRMNAASEAIKKFDDTRNDMGMTPDDVRATPEWQAAKNELEAARKQQQDANANVVKNFPKEHRADIDKRREEKVSAAQPDSQQEPEGLELVTIKDIDGNWAKFAKESGTLNVPRAEMPQIKAEHRGAMVNFMNARGIGHQEETVPASSLKPTQAEFSREKVAKAKGYEGGNRSILVSRDGHVLDGHHQWMAARESGENVKAIRLDAPIKDLLVAAREFPSSTVDEQASPQADSKAIASTNHANDIPAPAQAQKAQKDLQKGNDALIAEVGKLAGMEKRAVADYMKRHGVEALEAVRDSGLSQSQMFSLLGDRLRPHPEFLELYKSDKRIGIYYQAEAEHIKGLSTDAYSALVADTREAHEFTPAMSYAVLRHSDQKAEIEYIGKLGRMANRFRIVSQEAGGKLNKMARPYVDMVRQEKNQQQVVESDTPSELPSAATTEPNLESARKLLQEQKDATGNKKAEANVKRKIRALAKKTPITDERTVLALDMAATRLGMESLEFSEPTAAEAASSIAPGASEAQQTPAADPGRKYHVVRINEKTGKKITLSDAPMTHQEAVTFKSKQTKYEWARDQLEEVTEQTPAAEAQDAKAGADVPAQQDKDLVDVLAGMSNAEMSALIDEIESEDSAVADTAKPVTKRKRKTSPKSGTPKPRQQISEAEATDIADEADVERTAGEILKSFGYNSSKAGAEGVQALLKMFGGNGRLNSGLSFDEETYAAAKPHFQAMLEDAQAAGKDIKDFLRLVVRTFGSGIKPYIIRFANDQRDVVAARKTGETNEQLADGDADQGGAPEVRGRGSLAQQGTAQADSGDVAQGQPEDGGAAGEIEGSGRPGVRVSGTDVAGDGRVSEVGDAGDGRTRTGRAGSPDAGTRADGTAGAKGGTGSRGGNAAPVTSPAATSVQAQDLHIENPLEVVGGTPVQRFNRNRAALELLQTLEEEGRQATADEQKVLAGYTGWGSFGQELFQGSWDRPVYRDEGVWKERGQWLRDTLGESAWKSAQRSITNAHYTDPPTVMAMWDMVRRMGFKGGRVLEPSLGTGNFYSMMPADLKARSELTGIELDETTGAIAKHLFPKSNIRIMGYQESQTPDNFYDLVIGNWPFENTPIADRRYNKLNPMLHDYFFLKTMDQVRPGGIVIGITSAGSMDKQNTSIRRELARQAELVASIRLPSGAFEDYAGTSVVTDIVILRKRPERLVAVPEGSTWVETTKVGTQSGNEVRVNQYYADNPQNIIGTLDFDHGTTTFRAGMVVRRPDNMAERLKQAVEMVPEGAMQERQQTDHLTYYANETGERHGSLAEVNGKLMVAVGDQIVEANQKVKYQLKDEKKTEAREQELKAIIGVRRMHSALVDAERQGQDAKAARKDLRDAYQGFVKEHGPIRESFALNYLRRIEDPFYAEVAALENDDGTPAAVMERSTTRSKRSIKNPTVRDAYVLARNQAISPDIEDIAKLANKPADEVRAELLESGAVFEAPNGDIVPSDIYLSGNVREKLREAQAAVADGNSSMQKNVDALTEVVPEDIPYFNIETKVGATWVSNDVYAQYISHMLGRSNTDGIEVAFRSGRWKVRLDSNLNKLREASTNYGTEHYTFSQLVQAAMSNQTLRLRSRDSEGNEYYDQAKSEEANARLAKIREDFASWLWSDPERRQVMEREYNESRNAWATPKYDGSFLTFEGMALTLGDGEFNLRKHQVDAIWRAIVNRRSLNAHEVGTGKTFTMGGIAVESRRYGLAKKPVILAHNANSATVAAEIRMMYPSARVLYVDNLDAKNREVRLRQIANDDWDAIVIPHSLIDRMSLREETLMQMAADDIADLESEFFEAAREDGVDPEKVDLNDDESIGKIRSVTAKELAKARKRIIESIKKQAQESSKEGAVTFEDLGIDMILVDEVHEFKKPPIVTRMQMKGLNTQVSQRSIGLQFLTRYVRQINNGGNVHTFTGTPITNTITEIYHQMRYVMESEMEQAGVADWDGWFGSFATEVQDVELSAAGDYEMVTRLAGFVNVPELRQMAGQYMDTVFAEDMPEMKPREVNGKRLGDDSLTEKERAELLNGRTEGAKDRPYKKVVNESADMTDKQSEVFREIQGYAQDWRDAGGKQRREWMREGDPRSPIVTEGIANKASFDVRLLDESLAGMEGKTQDDPNSKASRVVNQVLEIYNSHPQAGQVIFAEQGFSKSVRRSKSDGQGGRTSTTHKVFSTIHDIVERLVQGGIPREQIAIVDGKTNKEKRKEIALAMNEGTMRVVIGSTDTLGVGVNMQRNLRAMHHMDAPYMPGELEQRNGRGQRQGNQWNTVMEYRYMTDRLDGRRWQILAVKQRFINAFMKSHGNVRVIEGEAAADEQSDILESFSEAAGDPRILQRAKLQKKEESLMRKERMYTQGIADMRRQVRSSKEAADRANRELAAVRDSKRLENIAGLIESQREQFRAEIGGRKFDSRKDAAEGLAAYIEANIRMGDRAQAVGTYGGQELMVEWRNLDAEPVTIIRAFGESFDGKGIAGAEARMRNYPSVVEKIEIAAEQAQATADNLSKAMEQPFGQAEELARVSRQLEDIEQDLAVNPVPPPAWLRQGAPVDSEVFRNKRSYVVTGHRYSKDGWFVVAEDDKGTTLIPYMEAVDEAGMQLYEEREFVAPEVIEKAGAPKDGDEQPVLEKGDRYEVVSYQGKEDGPWLIHTEGGFPFDNNPDGGFKTADEAVAFAKEITGNDPERKVKGWGIDGSGVQFSFAGQKSGTAMHGELAKAKRMAARGVGNEDIRQATGWHRGADGKWRYEISDHDAKLAVSGKNMGEVIDMATIVALTDNRKQATIGDVMDHPALFRAYPGLADIQVRKMDDPSRTAIASVRVTGKEFIISLNPRARGDYALSALLHELQHAIQTIEGFARGGNARMAAGLANLSVPSKAAANAYMRLSGEVEARNTQARMRMDDEFRKLFPPSETQDVSDADAIVTFNGSEVQDFTAADPITKQELREVFTSRFPRLAKALDGMLAKGDKRESGGLVILDSADPLRIAGQFSKITGRNLNESIRLFSNAEDAQGFFDPRSGLTFLVGPSVNETNAAAVVLHEAIHGQQNKRLDQAAVQMLVNRKQERNADTRAFLDRVVRRMAQAEGGVTELEAAAYIVEQAIMEGRDGTAGQQVDAGLIGWIERNLGKTVADLVRGFVRAYRQFAIRNGLGLNVTVDDMIQYAQASMKQSARTGANPYGGGPGGGVRQSTAGGFKESAYRPQVVSWAKNRFGDQIAPNGRPAWQNFVEWFGDSKVVDADGKPLVVYHGSPDVRGIIDGGFTQSPLRGNVFFFTDSAAVADTYADDSRAFDYQNAEPHVLPLYLSMQNPYVVDAKGAKWRETERHIKEARDGGHDGIIIRNSRDEYNNLRDGGQLSTVYAVFEPTQVKSAATGNLRSRIDGIDLGDISNRGTFDPANPDIRFSRSGIKGMASAATAELNRTFNAPGKLSLWHKTIGTMYNLAERSPHFKPVFEAAQGFIDDVAHFATDAAELAPTLLPSLETWRDIAKKPITSKDNAAIAKPIFEGTLSWTRDDTGKPVRLEDGDDAQAGIVWTDDELRSMFDLNDKQVQLYREFRDATNRSLDTMARADMLRFGGKDLKAIQAEAMDAADVHDAARVIVRHLKEMADENPDRKTELMQTAHGIAERAERVQELQDQGYAPLSRFGQYTVDVVVDGERQYFGLFETMREANKMKEAMAAEFGAGNVSQGTLSNETYKLFAGVTPETLELFGNMLGLDSDGDAAQDKAFQDYLRLTKTNRSAMRRLIHRKGIAGYSEDVGRVLASFVYSNSRQTAAGLNIGELGDAINAIPKEQGELKDAAVRLGEYIKNPQEEGQVIRGFLFAQYLGGSVASAFVNLTQPVQVTFPWLTQFTSATNAAAQLGKAVKQMSTRGLKYEADLAAALKAAEDDGTVSPQEIHQLMGQARGKGSLKAGDGTRAGEARAAMANATARLSLAWGKMFSSAEQANRRITFIAAYRIARDAKMADPAGFARRAVRETQFVYSKAAKMQWGRGAVGGTLMTFKTYSVSYIELMHRLWTQGEPGSVERAQGRKAAMVMIATLFLISGAGGLPFAEDAEDLIDGAAQLMGYNFSSKKVREDFIAEVFGDAIADFIDKGVSGLPGAPMDVSGRLGLGNLIPGTGLFQERTSHTRDVLEILGPGGDFVDRVVSGGRKVLGGNVTAGMLEMSPVAVRNLAKGTDMAVHGMYRDSKGYKVLDTNILEAAAKAAGFQPATVAKIQEANWINQRAKNYYSMRAQEIRQMWASGIFEKNQNKVQQARQAIADWNAKNPDQPMLIRIPDVMRRVREMAKTKDERIAATAPKAMRQQMREDLARVRETL